MAMTTVLLVASLFLLLSSLRQLFQQRLGLLQVLGSQAFGEPVVNLCQQLVSFNLLALSLSEASHACHRAHSYRSLALRLRARSKAC